MRMTSACITAVTYRRSRLWELAPSCCNTHPHRARHRPRIVAKLVLNGSLHELSLEVELGVTPCCLDPSLLASRPKLDKSPDPTPKNGTFRARRDVCHILRVRSVCQQLSGSASICRANAS